jgi:hypothetical protein
MATAAGCEVDPPALLQAPADHVTLHDLLAGQGEHPPSQAELVDEPHTLSSAGTI